MQILRANPPCGEPLRVFWANHFFPPNVDIFYYLKQYFR